MACPTRTAITLASERMNSAEVMEFRCPSLAADTVWGNSTCATIQTSKTSNLLTATYKDYRFRRRHEADRLSIRGNSSCADDAVRVLFAHGRSERAEHEMLRFNAMHARESQQWVLQEYGFR